MRDNPEKFFCELLLCVWVIKAKREEEKISPLCLPLMLWCTPLQVDALTTKTSNRSVFTAKRNHSCVVHPIFAQNIKLAERLI